MLDEPPTLVATTEGLYENFFLNVTFTIPSDPLFAVPCSTSSLPAKSLYHLVDHIILKILAPQRAFYYT